MIDLLKLKNNSGLHHSDTRIQFIDSLNMSTEAANSFNGGIVEMINHIAAPRKRGNMASSRPKPALFSPKVAPVIINIDAEFEEFVRDEFVNDSKQYLKETEEVVNEPDVQNLGKYDCNEYNDFYNDEEMDYMNTATVNVVKTGPITVGRGAKVQLVALTVVKNIANGWSSSVSKAVANALVDFVPEEEDDEELIEETDDTEYFTMPVEKHISTQQIPVVRRENDARVIPAMPKVEEENPITKMRQTMTGVYDKNITMMMEYMKANISAPEKPIKKSVIEPRQPQLKPKTNRFAELEEIIVVVKTVITVASEPVHILSPDRSVPIRAYRYEESESESETESELSNESGSDPVIAEPEKVLSVETMQKVAARVERIKAKAELDKQKAAARAAAAAAAAPVVQYKKTKNREDKKKTKNDVKLMQHLFNDVKAVNEDVRTILTKVYDPSTIMTLYSMIARAPDEIIKCRDNPEYTVPIPPLSSSSDLMVASPTRANVISYPIVPPLLCRNGMNCAWFTSQAHKMLGNTTYQSTYECNCFHVGPTPLIIDNKKFIQCALFGCTHSDHYTPNDNKDFMIIHMTPSVETCIYDNRNFCQNALGDGCCRKHLYAGPLIVSMIMRAMLFEFIPQPNKWPIGDYEFMFGMWRQIVQTKIPGSMLKFESRFKLPGLWPPQETREERQERQERQHERAAKQDRSKTDKIRKARR